MVQDQLVDYISSQIKLGVSKEAIKSALVSAGWVSTDVDDTLKKIEGPAKPAMPSTGPAMSVGSSTVASTGASSAVGSSPFAKPTQSPAMGSSPSISSGVSTGSSATTGSSAGSPFSKPTVSSTGSTGAMSSTGSASGKSAWPQPQMVRMSDLVSSPASGSGSMGSMSGGPKMSSTVAAPAINSVTSSMSSRAVGQPSVAQKKGGKAGAIIAWILVLLLAGAAGYFYMQNDSLNSKVSTLTSENASEASQLASLQSEGTPSSTTDSQVSTLTAANTELALELSFYAVPPGSTSATPASVTITGTLSVLKNFYSITTPHGAKIFISSATSATTLASLKPLAGDNVQLVGAYVPGSDEITPTSVTNLSPVPAGSSAGVSSSSASTGATGTQSTTTAKVSSSTTPSL